MGVFHVALPLGWWGLLAGLSQSSGSNSTTDSTSPTPMGRRKPCCILQGQVRPQFIDQCLTWHYS